MRMRRTLVAACATLSALAADQPLVTVNVVVATNVAERVDVANGVPDDAGEAAKAVAARKRSAIVVGQLIADMKPVPGRAYLLGRTEVTAEQWHSVVKPDVPFAGTADLPVSGVSWDDCQDFIKLLNERSETAAAGLSFRLPTAREWRHACLAGAKGKWGRISSTSAGQIDAMGWHTGNSGKRKSAVARKPPNVWGFHDMHGNVFEWCADTSPEYGGDFRLRVGGSFRTPPEQCEAWFANSANRQFSRYDDQGFRLLAERR